MRRALTPWLLVFCILGQGIAAAYAGAGNAEHGDAFQQRLHVLLEPHHHNADGSVDFDDSIASLLHMMADSLAPTTPAPEIRLTVAPMADASPSRGLDRGAPSACLEGPLRPPRSTV